MALRFPNVGTPTSVRSLLGRALPGPTEAPRLTMPPVLSGGAAPTKTSATAFAGPTLDIAAAAQKTTRLQGLLKDGAEAEALQLLAQASAFLLNFMLTNVSVAALFGGLRNHVFGADNRTAFVSLLAHARLQDISIENRAALVTALQTGWTGHGDETVIRDILLGTRGLDLTALKNQIDRTGDHHDLQQLIFHDIDDAGIRKVILRHIAVEAKRVPPQGAKVMSDIDDTFFASLKDKRFPAKVPYPGIRQFYIELGAPERGNVVYLTARPRDPFSALENAVHKMLRGHGVGGTVLSGDVLHWGWNIGVKKLDNYDEYRKLYPEYDTVWIGDSGQDDVKVAQGMYARKSGDMRAAFIDDVVATPAAERAKLSAEGIYLVDNYVEAASQAFKLQLISAAGLERVIAAAERELAAMLFASAAQKNARQAELDQAKVAARRVLAAAS